MNNTTYTPGPWAYNYDDRIVYDVPTDGDSLYIKVSDLGDAHLIAAAPAMYEALKALLAHEGERQYSGIGTEHDSDTLEGAKRSAKTALAQAEGHK